ncbi:RNA polymerase sigma factor [Lachnospiraceae bacterium 29-84]
MNGIPLEQCIEQYGTELYAFCSQLTRNKQEAEDLYQDTFLKAIELGKPLIREDNPKSYLVSIALRIWKNRKRKYAWRNRIAGTGQYIEGDAQDADCCIWHSPEEALLEQELYAQVQDAVASLDDKYRIPIYLYYTLQLPCAQIGKILKLPQGTVKSRLHKARKQLKQELETIWGKS